MAQLVVKLGNPSPRNLRDPRTLSTTTVRFADGITDPEFVERTLSVPKPSTRFDLLIKDHTDRLPDEHKIYGVAVHHLRELWPTHSDAGGPSWVASDDAVLQNALAKYFDCLSGEPTALQVTAGVDAMFAQNLDVGSQPAAFGWGCLSANTTTPAAGDTSITGEITTASGGLIRHTMTYAHTGGASTATMTNTWTANGSDSLPVTIAKYGLLNASSSGTLGYEDLLSSTVTISASGNSITVTHTITI